MNKKPKQSNKQQDKDVDYSSIPSVYVLYNSNNSWVKRREETLQQVASYTNYASPFV